MALACDLRGEKGFIDPSPLSSYNVWGTHLLNTLTEDNMAKKKAKRIKVVTIWEVVEGKEKGKYEFEWNSSSHSDFANVLRRINMASVQELYDSLMLWEADLNTMKEEKE